MWGILLFNHRTYESAGPAPWSPEVRKHSRVVLENLPEFLEPGRECQLGRSIKGAGQRYLRVEIGYYYPFTSVTVILMVLVCLSVFCIDSSRMCLVRLDGQADLCKTLLVYIPLPINVRTYGFA